VDKIPKKTTRTILEHIMMLLYSSCAAKMDDNDTECSILLNSEIS